MKYLKSYRLFENQGSDIQDLKDYLLILTDKGYFIEVNGDELTDYLNIVIHKGKWHSGHLFNMSDILEELRNIYDFVIGKFKASLYKVWIYKRVPAGDEATITKMSEYKSFDEFISDEKDEIATQTPIGHWLGPDMIEISFDKHK